MILRYLLSISLLSLLISGVSAAQSVESVKNESVLRLGIFPRRNMQVTDRMFRPLSEKLSSVTGMNVLLETTHDFASFWENVSNKQYDIVHYNQYHYLKSHKHFGYQVFARNVEFNHDKIAGAILIRKDSGINSIQDLKGKTIVFGGGRGAMMAYITATYLLRQAGLKEGDYFEQFALNPPKACIATYYRKATAAGAGNYVLELPNVRQKIDTSEMRYLATSKKMAHLPWAVKKTVPTELREKLLNAMVGLADTKEGRVILKAASITKIIPAADKDYDSHREIVKSVLNEEL